MYFLPMYTEWYHPIGKIFIIDHILFPFPMSEGSTKYSQGHFAMHIL